MRGDPNKKPPECEHDKYTPFSATFKRDPLRDAPNATGRWGSCPHLQEVGGGMDGERYRCDVCGESFFLDYEEMK